MPFEKIKKNFGFGCMRMKMAGEEVDYDEFCKMIDAFLDAGFNYFDTAHGYINFKSQAALRECLVKRHDREDFVLANKLTPWFIEKEEDVMPFFESQLSACGVDYFDFYLFHCMNKDTYKKQLSCNSFEIVKRLRDEGKIRHIAMSFHDTADVLDMILTEQPLIEAVQLQFNYLDYDDPGVQSKACYDVARKHGKPIMVMEPVKGGVLVNLPDKAGELLRAAGGGSHASYALRFAASFPGVFMVLSGMGNMDMVRDNLDTFSDFKPLSDEEFEMLSKAREIIREARQIPCTACRYCTEGCPKSIPIPEAFAAYNKYLAAKITRRDAKALIPSAPPISDCIKCGRCEELCPQGIEIRARLEEILK